MQNYSIYFFFSFTILEGVIIIINSFSVGRNGHVSAVSCLKSRSCVLSVWMCSLIQSALHVDTTTATAHLRRDFSGIPVEVGGIEQEWAMFKASIAKAAAVVRRS